MLHNVMLCYRSATAPLPTGAATFGGQPILPTSPQPSRCFMMPAHRRARVAAARASKGAGGQVWWSSLAPARALSVDGATFASRTLAAGKVCFQV